MTTGGSVGGGMDGSGCVVAPFVPGGPVIPGAPAVDGDNGSAEAGMLSAISSNSTSAFLAETGQKLACTGRKDNFDEMG